MEVKLTDEINANVWAKEFMRIYGKETMQGNVLWIDEDLMRAWFANAIMTGYDIGQRKILSRIDEERIRKVFDRFVEVGENKLSMMYTKDMADKLASAIYEDIVRGLKGE